MKLEIRHEAGHDYAMEGLALNKNKKPEDMPAVAVKLAPMGGGHSKFLESIVVWVRIRAPRFWWQEFDTYRVGTTKQSESTMHTLKNRPLEQGDFEKGVHPVYLQHLNTQLHKVKTLSIEMKTDRSKVDEYREELLQLKNDLPEGFLQARMVCFNYMTIRNIITQRQFHGLQMWRDIAAQLLNELEHPEYFADLAARVKE